MILAGGFRQALNSQLALRELDDALSKASTQEEQWVVLREALGKFGFAEVCWFVEGKLYQDTRLNVDEHEGWNLRIALKGRDYINFTRVTKTDDASLNFSALVAILRKYFTGSPELAAAASVNAALPLIRKPSRSAFTTWEPSVERDPPA